MARFVCVLSSLFLAGILAFAQSSTQALTVANEAMTTMTHGLPVTDATMSGSVTWIAGSDYSTGTGRLEAKDMLKSRIDVTLGDIVRNEVRTSSAGIPTGAWTEASTTQTHTTTGPFAMHNCWTDAAWFFPALSSLAQVSNAGFVFTYVGIEQHAGVNTQHIQIFQVPALAPEVSSMVERLSTMDFYLDSVSLLPVALTFKVHPDDDMGSEIPAEIRFGNYQSVNGIQIPFHVQRIINGIVVLDFVVNSAAINSGLPDSDFDIQ